ncbi:MAG: type II secretion system protein GspL, partial [Sphingomonadaceae bacterium]
MSADETLLLFIDRDGGFESWLRLGEGGVAARGEGLAGMPPLVDPGSGELARLAVAVPAEKVAIHWLEVPTGLAPAQSVAAARLAAADLTAQPLAEMHVAVGRESDADESRCIAIVPHILMTDWLERCQAEGLDPDLMLPEPLLILPPAEGFTRCDRHGPPLYRGPKDAFAIEPELAGVVTGDAPVETIGRGQFESGLPRARAPAPRQLRQGAVAQPRPVNGA